MMKRILLAFLLTLLFVRVADTAPSGIGVGSIVKQTSALATNLVLKNKCAPLQCILTSFEVSADSTLSGAAWWVLIYDATAAPADGAVTPAKCYAMASGATSFSAAFNIPPFFVNGIVIQVSTTGCFTQTSSAHAFISGDVQ